MAEHMSATVAPQRSDFLANAAAQFRTTVMLDVTRVYATANPSARAFSPTRASRVTTVIS